MRLEGKNDHMSTLLSVHNLSVDFEKDGSRTSLVENISFELMEGEVFGVVGESGSGKSITALSLMRLLPNGASVSSGSVALGRCDVLEMSDSELRRVRGNEISMIFQEPMTSLNPVFTVGNQIMESLRLHQGLSRRAARERAIDLLGLVGIPSPRRRIDEYPHQLSGGMRQRVMIAIALACDPKILIADEPTTALDVTIQAQILELLRDIQERLGLAIILITHDLGVVAEFADRIMVMYAGRAVEMASSAEIFNSPSHPYTKGLLASIPPLDEDVVRLKTIEGTVPSPQNLPKGCRFHPRCPAARDACTQIDPPLMALKCQHQTACIAPFGYTVPSKNAFEPER